MTGHLLRHNRLFRNRKGYSGLIATIFMVLVVIYLYTSVFSVIQEQNLNFQDATSQSQQIDTDRNTEKIAFSNVKYLTNEITFVVKNSGPIPVQIVRLWVIQNSTGTSQSYPLTLVLAPSEKISDVSVKTNDAPSGDVSFLLVTARGNLVSSGTG